MPYRYQHFSSQVLEEDAHFQTGPEPGQRMPEADRETVDGGTIHIGGRRERPMLLAFGSVTCPMTAASIPILKRMHERYGDEIDFVTLYVREAHPGDKVTQPVTFDDKMEHARRLRDEHGIRWPVAVDDIDGSLHRRLDPKPAAAYLVDHNGTVVFRTLWSDDPRSMRSGVSKFLDLGEPVGQSEPRIVPLLRGLWHLDEVLKLAGPEAEADLRREVPLMYWANRALRVVRHPAFPVGAAVALGLGVALLGRRSRS